MTFDFCQRSPQKKNNVVRLVPANRGGQYKSPGLNRKEDKAGNNRGHLTEIIADEALRSAP